MNHCIYKFTSPSGKCYIGQTNNIRRRLHQHRSNKSSHCAAFSAAITKYGFEAFVFELLHEGLSLDDANRLEPLYIIENNAISPNGYNLRGGGDANTMHDTTKAKISAANKGRPPSEECRRKALEAVKTRVVSTETRHKMHLANVGKTLSQEHRDKIGAAHAGKKRDEACRARMSERMLGRTHSAETKAKMAQSHKGRVCTTETRDKIRMANTGRVYGAETRAKMSQSKRGVKRPPFTEETLQRMRDAQKGRTNSPEAIAKRKATMLAKKQAKIEHRP